MYNRKPEAPQPPFKDPINSQPLTDPVYFFANLNNLIIKPIIINRSLIEDIVNSGALARFGITAKNLRDYLKAAQSINSINTLCNKYHNRLTPEQIQQIKTEDLIIYKEPITYTNPTDPLLLIDDGWTYDASSAKTLKKSPMTKHTIPVSGYPLFYKDSALALLLQSVRVHSGQTPIDLQALYQNHDLSLTPAASLSAQAAQPIFTLAPRFLMPLCTINSFMELAPYIDQYGHIFSPLTSSLFFGNMFYQIFRNNYYLFTNHAKELNEKFFLNEVRYYKLLVGTGIFLDAFKGYFGAKAKINRVNSLFAKHINLQNSYSELDFIKKWLAPLISILFTSRKDFINGFYLVNPQQYLVDKIKHLIQIPDPKYLFNPSRYSKLLPLLKAGSFVLLMLPLLKPFLVYYSVNLNPENNELTFTSNQGHFSATLTDDSGIHSELYTYIINAFNLVYQTARTAFILPTAIHVAKNTTDFLFSPTKREKILHHMTTKKALHFTSKMAYAFFVFYCTLEQSGSLFAAIYSTFFSFCAISCVDTIDDQHQNDDVYEIDLVTILEKTNSPLLQQKQRNAELSKAVDDEYLTPSNTN